MVLEFFLLVKCKVLFSSSPKSEHLVGRYCLEPSLAYGADFILQFEGVNVLTINPDSE